MSAARILVTGSEGLVGASLVARLLALGHDVSGFDLRARAADARGDVRDPARLGRAIAGREGIVHLAAVSRVVWAERQPELCSSTNVDALRELLRLALAARPRPWVVFVSSREVYGQAARLPASESAPLAPINAYARAKVAGERLCVDAARAGLCVAIVRLSNVFGSARDHADRVVPAFVRAALACEPLRVEGAKSIFDFTHIDDAVSGLTSVVELLRARGETPPPLQLVTGVPTSLSDLAALVSRLSGSSSRILEAPSRSFDVARFYGDPSRAGSVLGWRARVPLDEGIAGLIAEFRALEQRATAPAAAS